MLIKDPPRNLVINLKWFTETMTGYRKSSKIVLFPIHLNLDKFCIHEIETLDQEYLQRYEESNTDSEWEPVFKYELYGVVTHSGSMSSGHYIAYVSYKYKDHRQWHYFSDWAHWSATEQQVLSSEEYLLFYRWIFV